MYDILGALWNLTTATLFAAFAAAGFFWRGGLQVVLSRYTPLLVAISSSLLLSYRLTSDHIVWEGLRRSGTGLADLIVTVGSWAASIFGYGLLAFSVVIVDCSGNA